MDEETKQHYENHLQEIRHWLDEHVQAYETPRSVSLSDFQVDWESLKGSFLITLDNLTLIERFDFSPEQSGKPIFFTPMFHSPLGAPCSYSAIELTSFTKLAVEMCLRKAIPRSNSRGNEAFLAKKQAQKTLEATNSVSISVIDAYLAWMRQRKKCSPIALAWKEFHKFLQKHQTSTGHSNEKIPNPLILGGDIANGNEKLERLGEQLKYAENYGILDDALHYLESLSRRDWAFCKDEDWSYVHP